MFGSFIMTYIEYATIKYYNGNQLDEHGNTCYVAEKVWMIVANILIIHIYVTHPMAVFIHSSWNIDMNLTLFYPYFFHVDLVILVQSWTPPKIF